MHIIYVAASMHTYSSFIQYFIILNASSTDMLHVHLRGMIAIEGRATIIHGKSMLGVKFYIIVCNIMDNG